MPFLLDEFNEMYNSDNYYFYSKHRSKVNKVASVWLIDLKEEFSLCEDAIKKDICRTILNLITKDLHII